MSWHAQLDLNYRLEAARSVARHQHKGPLRILQSLYPEGDAICHNVLVHPPGGLVGGDTLDITVQVEPGAHGLITTPGATRFYRSAGPLALQNTQIKVASGGRLEWLPTEAICYHQCHAENRVRFELEPGAELMGWDVTAFGLPQANQPFAQGQFVQHLELPGVWLERGRIDALDTRLMDSPLGLAGYKCMASLFFLAGSKLDKHRQAVALDVARQVIDAHSLHHTAGATSPDGQVVVVRVLAPLVEPAMDLVKQVWAAWRAHFWGLSATKPRIWAM
nr:urease accessory protein UreD [uncultured Albidiferax sp.]